MRRNLLQALGALVVLLMAGLDYPEASPRVLFDSGDTLDLSALAEESGLSPSNERDIEPARMPEGNPLFPVESKALSPGETPRQPTGERGANLIVPLFLVGDDAFSHEWLAANKERLRAAGAAGLMVTARDREAYQEMVNLAATAGLPLALGVGDEVATLFGISHYPVLIGPDWIEQ